MFHSYKINILLRIRNRNKNIKNEKIAENCATIIIEIKLILQINNKYIVEYYSNIN